MKLIRKYRVGETIPAGFWYYYRSLDGRLETLTRKEWSKVIECIDAGEFWECEAPEIERKPNLIEGEYYLVEPISSTRYKYVLRFNGWNILTNDLDGDTCDAPDEYVWIEHVSFEEIS